MTLHISEKVNTKELKQTCPPNNKQSNPQLQQNSRNLMIVQLFPYWMIIKFQIPIHFPVFIYPELFKCFIWNKSITYFGSAYNLQVASTFTPNQMMQWYHQKLYLFLLWEQWVRRPTSILVLEIIAVVIILWLSCLVTAFSTSYTRENLKRSLPSRRSIWWSNFESPINSNIFCTAETLSIHFSTEETSCGIAKVRAPKNTDIYKLLAFKKLPGTDRPELFWPYSELVCSGLKWHRNEHTSQNQLSLLPQQVWKTSCS